MTTIYAVPKKRSPSQSFSVVIVKSPNTINSNTYPNPTMLSNNPHTRRRRRRRTSPYTSSSSSFTQKCTHNAPILLPVPVDINDPSIHGYPALLYDKTTHAVSFIKGDRSVPPVTSLSDKRTEKRTKKRTKKKKKRTKKKKNTRERGNNGPTPLHEYIKSFSMSD